MSKKTLKKLMKLNKVYAIPSKQVKDANGNVVKTLYNIYK